MPTKTKHLSIVNSNFSALQSLVKDNPNDHSSWLVIIVFYMALHYLQAFFDHKFNEDVEYHPQIQDKIARTPELKPIYDKYKKLRDDSEAARYKGKSFDIPYMRTTTLKHFMEIQKHICEKINENSVVNNIHNLFPCK